MLSNAPKRYLTVLLGQQRYRERKHSMRRGQGVRVWVKGIWRSGEMGGGWVGNGWEMGGGWVDDGWEMDGGWMGDGWGMGLAYG